jgi:hypothetical protein
MRLGDESGEPLEPRPDVDAASSGDSNALVRYTAALAGTAFGVAAIAAGVIFPPATILAAAAPLVQVGAERLLRRLTDGEDVLAEEHVTADDVAEAITRNEAVVDLLHVSVAGVLASRDRAQRRLLARALARGVKDDAQVDPQLRYARTVSQMDVPEVMALRTLCQHRENRVSLKPEDQEGARPEDTLFPDELRLAHPEFGDTAEEVMAKLVALGLAYDRAGITLDGRLHWAPTGFGRSLLSALERETD